jgi:hypothetical protein
MDKCKPKTVLNKWLSQINFNNLSVKSQQLIEDFDKYQKKIDCKTAISLFLHAINVECESLRALETSLVNQDLAKEMNLESFSYSQLSRILKSLDTSVLMEIFGELLKQVHQKTTSKARQKIFLIDSSTFSMKHPKCS